MKINFFSKMKGLEHSSKVLCFAGGLHGFGYVENTVAVCVSYVRILDYFSVCHVCMYTYGYTFGACWKGREDVIEVSQAKRTGLLWISLGFLQELSTFKWKQS